MNRYQVFCRRAAAEGMVLLKNEQGVLPLQGKQKIALFGRGQFVTFKSGAGSGDVVGVKTVNALEGLENAGMPLCMPLRAYNTRWHEAHFEEVKNSDKYYDRMPPCLQEIPLDDEILEKARADAQVAVVILGRVIGEGTDIQLKKGDYYLSDGEEEMLSRVRQYFRKMVVCLNYGGMYDLQGVLKYQPEALLYMSQGGQQVGNALADVLLGIVTPSGKLTDTWAKQYADYPSAAHFGEMTVPYREGIYVGYRYFDSFNVTPLYPFGYGGSYTDFEITAEHTCLEHSRVQVTATVKNIGNYSGKEVLQCYLSKPDGRLEQPYQELVAFRKTALLQPGASQLLVLSFDMRECASYDTESASFVLPQGMYDVRLGNSSRNTRIVARLSLSQTVPVLKTENRFPANVVFEELSHRGAVSCSYAEEAAQRKAAAVLTLNVADIPTQMAKQRPAPKILQVKPEYRDRCVTIRDVALGQAAAEDLVAQMSLDELGCILNGVNYGQDTYEGGIIGSMADAVPGAAGETFTLPKYEIRGNVCADGPAGIRLLSSHDDFEKIAPDDPRRTLTAYPIGTCLANSWDVELAQEYGQCIAEEMRRFQIHGWLAPGMNIHRNPLCGRNFEYFSEDPLLSGCMAAAQTAGVQIKDGKPTGCYTTIKHFAVNNQENLRTQMTSEVQERALREIYLKPFEIAVKKSQPHALMTAYNRINGIYAAVHTGLLNGVLRSEWDFAGIVMSDWGAQGAVEKRVLAGNDLNMPGSGQQCIKLLKNGSMDIAAAQACAVRILNWLVKTNHRVEG